MSYFTTLADSREIGTELVDHVNGLDLETIAARIPVVTATVPHHSRSSRYVPIPTIDVLEGLYADGFRATKVIQAKARTPERMLTARHAVRLRHIDDFGITEGSVPEISMINALDGSAAHKFFCGFIRFECFNGMIVGEAFENFSVRHIGTAAIEASRAAVRKLREVFPAMRSKVESFKLLTVDSETEQRMAKRAFDIRFDAKSRSKMISEPIHQLTRARRPSDTGRDLWSTFNRLQENVTRGGLRAIVLNDEGIARNSTARGVNAIGANVNLNRELWDGVLELTAKELTFAA